MKKGLGRGLGSLLGGTEDAVTHSDEAVTEKDITELRLFEVEPNKNQPRKTFDEEAINVLAESIRENGVIQPIIVTKNSMGYTIVAGERRWRAAKKAGLSTIPAVIREYSPEQIAEIALIENLQREDLNPIEEALGYRSLMDDFKLTQEDVAAKVGRSRSAVANTLRLLSLEEEIREHLIAGDLSGGHARAILSVPDRDSRIMLAERIIAEDLNVRQAEALAKRMKSPKKTNNNTENEAYRIQLDKIQDSLSAKFGTKVKITKGAKKSRIEFEYYDEKDFERLLELLYREDI